MRRVRTKVLCACALALAASGCGSVAPAPAAKPVKPPEAYALLVPTKGHGANGMIRFTQEGARVLVSGEVHNLPPDSVHGFHLHETGDCSAPDAMSAGGHFNPDGAPHGPQSAAHHAGDLPAIKANANGVAVITLVIRDVTLSAGAHSIVGKALIVHQDADDYTTQPTGNSGARIACGVVTLR